MNHLKFMEISLNEARKAALANEVPVGAVVVDASGEIISKAHNLKESSLDPCGHAEILAIKSAAQRLKTWRLQGCRLYVTLEPCMMCSGAIVQARLESVHFGAFDPKGGFVESLAKGFEYPLNHKPSWTGGIMELECSLLLKKFFQAKRKASH